MEVTKLHVLQTIIINRKQETVFKLETLQKQTHNKFEAGFLKRTLQQKSNSYNDNI